MALHRVVRENMALAAAVGPWTQRDVVERVAAVIGISASELVENEVHAPLRRALRGMVRRSQEPLPVEEIEEILRARVPVGGWDPTYRLVRPALVPEPPRAGVLPLPPIASIGELAERWRMGPSTLQWLADPAGRNPRARSATLRHYHYRWVPKRSGRGHRLLEIPRPRLAHTQRRMLDEVVSEIPVHPAAHGFVPGRSVLGHVRPHCGSHTVITLDLQSWFWHVGFGRVRGLFRHGGLPRPVCDVLAGLATASVPPPVIAARPDGPDLPPSRRFDAVLLRGPHLPQGAPTSPALANAVAWRLDQRLAGLAKHVGATYPRYADDLALSGDDAFGLGASRLVGLVTGIVAEEGFRLNPAKTRVQRRGNAQRICGIVVNDHPAVPRAQRDRLEAMLVNAGRHGLDRLVAEGHADPLAYLEGRVGWVEQVHPRQGVRLRHLLEQVPRSLAPQAEDA